MTVSTLSLPDEAATAAIGAKLASVLRPGDMVLLEGNLGAGKTTLARGLIAAFAGAEEAPSPTYTLVETYEGERGQLWHFDLYRLEKSEEIWELGLEEALDNGILLIEWPERAGSLLPAGGLPLKIEIRPHGRALVIDASPDWAARLRAGGVL